MTNCSRIILLALLLTLGNFQLSAQCHVSSIPINTAYNPTTGLALPAGTTTTPSLDPHWIVSHATSTIPGAASPGSPAYVIAVVSGAWATNPAAYPGSWISCINSYTYDTYPDSVYNMTLSRPFTTCTDDSITFIFHIADDNYISHMDVDGTTLSFSQSGASSTYYSTFASFTQTVFLSAGTHQINVLVNNYPVSTYSSNPMGMDIYGSINSATGSVSIVYEADPACSGYACTYPPACNTLSMPDSVHLCGDSTVALTATLSGTDSVTSIVWSPTTGLSDTTVLNPTLTATASGMYYLTVEAAIPGNLAVNGSFTYGNSGFSSGYTHVASSTASGDYGIGPNPRTFNSAWAAIGDHTTGAGNMMCFDGALSSGVTAWCQSIPVEANSYYDFSFWVANLYATSPANLNITVNGVALGATFTATGTGTWNQCLNLWYSGTSTIANICITDANTAGLGNDFALDDISLTKVCMIRDSVYVQLKPRPIVNLGNDTALCNGNIVTLESSVAYTTPTFLWSTGSTAGSISPVTTGSYWLNVTQNGCSGRDTINVLYKPNPVVNLGNDTSLCSGTLITANIRPGAGVSYLWSTGATTSSIPISATGNYWVAIDSNGCTSSDTIGVTIYPDFSVDLGPDSIYCATSEVTLASSFTYSSSAVYLWSTGATSPSIVATTSGTYWLQVSQGACTRTDAVTVSITPPYSVNLGDDTLICHASNVTLQSSYSYTGAAYQWSTGASTPAITISSTGNYWLRVLIGGCMMVDTVNINIVHDSLVILTNDTAICKGTFIQVLANSYNFGNTYTYQWLPTAGIAASTSLNPIIAPDTSAMYVLQANIAGCPPVEDSVYIEVQPVPEVSLGGARQMCQYDTIHLVPSVQPSWFSGYIYNWTPATYLDHNNTPEVVFTAGITSNLYLTVTTSAGCTGEDSAQIIVHPGNFALAGNDAALCPHDSVELSVTAPAGTSYHWSPSYYLSDSSSGNPWVKPITSTVYTITATSSFGCLDTVHIGVTVYPSAVIYLPDSVTVYPGEAYPIHLQSNCTGFSWFPPEGLDNPLVADPTATPASSTKYLVTGTTDFGCKVVDSISIITSSSDLFALPNAFTPGNGVNNLFRIILRGEANLNYFRIFDRWGNMVFQTTSIDAGWDGNYNGTPQPFGVYVYELQATASDGTLFTKHGNLTLIK